MNCFNDQGTAEGIGRGLFLSFFLFDRYITVNERFLTMINQMVVSRDIEWIGYERKARMLQAEFIEGRVYQYANVDETVFHSFLEAPSHGQFFEHFVKGKYPYRRVK